MFTKEHTKAIKGIAVAALLFHHCFFATRIYNGFTVNFFPFPEDLVNHLALFCKFCVGMFAFCSGYGLSVKWKAQKKFSNYLTTQYISTMSGYWFAFLACCLICELLNGYTAQVYFSDEYLLNNLSGFLASFFGVSRLLGTPMLIYEWWYMSAAIVFILLVPIFCKSIEHIGMLATTALLVLLPRLIGVEFLGGTHPFSFLMPVLLGVFFEQKKCSTLFTRNWPGAITASSDGSVCSF